MGKYKLLGWLSIVCCMVGIFGMVMLFDEFGEEINKSEYGAIIGLGCICSLLVFVIVGFSFILLRNFGDDVRMSK